MSEIGRALAQTVSACDVVQLDKTIRKLAWSGPGYSAKDGTGTTCVVDLEYEGPVMVSLRARRSFVAWLVSSVRT